ncbi:Transcription and mRNA export factor eny2 [Coemansia sp. RSA 552]|nr:Transcription and mRNA export factor eny2 [Coemansia sp. RSA 552]
MSNETTGLREELLRRFIETGERERLQEILRNKLHASGWQDRVKDRCQRVVNENSDTIDKVTVDDIAEEVTPYARQAVPEEIKEEMLEDIRKFIYRALPENS